MARSYLDKVYDARGAEETRAIYDAWAAGYDAEVAENGYATPGRCASALHALSRDPAEPMLDVGCGTGLSGLAFRLAGFDVIDGVDLSPGMLQEARAKNVYRHLTPVGPGDPLPGGYRAMAAVGVIGAGAAPVDLLDRMVAALEPRGLMVFSFNEHTLEDPAYLARLDRFKSDGTLIERFAEMGDHLPARNLKSIVYVFEKA